jgi:dCTP deaminase
MLLSDQELRDELKSGGLRITPNPPEGRFQPASVDLCIASEIRRFKDDVNIPSMTINIETLSVDAFIAANTEVIDLSNGPLVIKPRDFVIGRTLERVYLNNALSGRVEGRSRLARMGIGVHITAPKIDPGFDNYITLEIVHHGLHRIEIPNGMAVCTLLVERLGTPSEQGYEGSFQGS